MIRQATLIKLAETLIRSLNEKLEPHHRYGTAKPFLQEGTSVYGWGPTDPGFALIGAHRLGPEALLASYQVALVLPQWVPANRGYSRGGSVTTESATDGGATLEDLQAIHAAYPAEGGAQRQSVPADGLIIYGAGYMKHHNITDRKLDAGALDRLAKLDSVVYASGGWSDSWPLVEVRGSNRTSATLFGLSY